MSNISRRQFFGSTAAVAAVGLTGAAHAADLCSIPQKWDHTVDVIIVGAGGAGLAAAITALIDQSDAEISSRTYQGLYLNDEFWSGVSQTFRDKKINVDGNCVDFSDSTLRCLKAYESMYPCLLHESTGAVGGEVGYNLDTRIAIQLRQNKGPMDIEVRYGDQASSRPAGEKSENGKSTAE